MEVATSAVAASLQPITLVSYETTLTVGTTRNRPDPLLEDCSGLIADRDFFVVFSPEGELNGKVFASLLRHPKLVGGLDEESESRAVSFYSEVLDFDQGHDLSRPNGVWWMGSAEAAELAKLAETTYWDVNIELAIQFTPFAEKYRIDISSVINAYNSQPPSHMHAPEIAVGGNAFTSTPGCICGTVQRPALLWLPA